ncbi:MAG: protein-disulfide isomerase [Cellvibrionales bacterium TMED122]|nr:protein-disulfide isomerase [Halieaceae bacterium]OUV59739.1 MAG: protein-disulfide isomerase [Cellvibrionales bacterium TMED122]
MPSMCALWISGASAQEIEDRMGVALSAFAGQPIGIESVRLSPAPGIVEVQVINGPLLYATEDGGYFFLNGDLHQVSEAGAVNLTEERRSSARKEQLAAVSLEDMVVFSPKGETRDYVSVFTDVTCFYCQKLHREVDQLNAKGVEVRYLAFPRGGINSDGAKKLATAWCADDQQTTLTELKAGMDLPVNDCADSPIAAQYQLGQEMGVSGTPAIITSSGMMIPGYRPAADLIVALGLD